MRRTYGDPVGPTMYTGGVGFKYPTNQNKLQGRQELQVEILLYWQLFLCGSSTPGSVCLRGLAPFLEIEAIEQSLERWSVRQHELELELAHLSVRVAPDMSMRPMHTAI